MAVGTNCIPFCESLGGLVMWEHTTDDRLAFSNIKSRFQSPSDAIYFVSNEAKLAFQELYFRGGIIFQR